jgi:hypothetical protein
MPGISKYLEPLYYRLKKLYENYPQILVLTGDYYNRLECNQTPFERVENDNCIVVCDDIREEYNTAEIFHIGGIFSIDIERGAQGSRTPVYTCWLAPGKSVKGEEAIFTHIKLHHFPNEHKESQETIEPPNERTTGN